MRKGMSMSQTPKPDRGEERRVSGAGGALAGLRSALEFPFKVLGRFASHTVQILFALFVLILHPQIKWLFGLLVNSYIVRNYIKPSLQIFADHVYEPFFARLGRLPPYWATFSIALPLAVLEPAKLFATILIAERPKSGVVLWLALQGLSLVLIDRTWRAVRPQSRKIWLVARLHAWGWLNVAYGKYWIRNSAAYRMAMLWRKRIRRLWAGLRRRRRGVTGRDDA
jgi:hypothetical protein